MLQVETTVITEEEEEIVEPAVTKNSKIHGLDLPSKRMRKILPTIIIITITSIMEEEEEKEDVEMEVKEEEDTNQEEVTGEEAGINKHTVQCNYEFTY